MAKALEGFLVIALEQAVAAPLCSCRLADAGARVIKIERPEGDFARGYDRLAAGESTYFVWLNRGKESVVLDLRESSAREALMRMIDQADVFIENLAPGAAARLGFGSDVLRTRNPRLVTVSIAGFAPGPARQRKMYDLLVQGESGLAGITGAPSEPGRVGISMSDLACGLNAYAAVLEALMQRSRTGEGRHIDVSLFDATAEWMTVPLLQHEGGKTPARIGVGHPTIAPYGAFATGDGRRIIISIQNEREWQNFCTHVLGDATIATDERFSSNVARVANRGQVDRQVSERFVAMPAEALVALLEQAGIAWGFLNTMAEFAAHPALARISVPIPGGEVAMPAPAARSGAVLPQFGAVPALGEHTERVLAEFAAR
jgi:crotonobetainyl-CoA:carnitine CoA-transferase CaiB-like acyl-CoA transferase